MNRIMLKAATIFSLLTIVAAFLPQQLGDNHQLDENHYEFEFSTTDHEQEKTIEVSKTIEDGQIEPLLNKLHFNKIALKKINEEAKLAEKEGYEFTLTGNRFHIQKTKSAMKVQSSTKKEPKPLIYKGF